MAVATRTQHEAVWAVVTLRKINLESPASGNMGMSPRDHKRKRHKVCIIVVTHHESAHQPIMKQFCRSGLISPLAI